MKKVWWLSLVILLALSTGLFVLTWRFTPTPADEELQLTPRLTREVSVTLPERQAAVDVVAMVGTCLFDPERGRGRKEAVTEAPPPERPNFELVGITRLGEESGAIIENKSQMGTDPKKSRRYYPTGAEVGNGFVLDSVLDELVILRRDGEVLELKIGRARFGEQSKGRALLQKVATEVPVEVVAPEVAAPVMPEQSGHPARLLPPGAAAESQEAK